jgi:hypothetical protein
MAGLKGKLFVIINICAITFIRIPWNTSVFRAGELLANDEFEMMTKEPGLRNSPHICLEGPRKPRNHTQMLWVWSVFLRCFFEPPEYKPQSSLRCVSEINLDQLTAYKLTINTFL